MELKRNCKGLKKYEALLKTICLMEDYHQLSESEWEGCLGVACVISVIEGVTSNLFSLSKHLDVPHYDPNIQHAFERLRTNGILSNRYNLSGDPSLTGKAEPNQWMTGVEVERNAWCMIAGISGGHMGMREKEVEKEVEK